MADVFISYAREDRQYAQNLAQKLETAGFTVWWDWDLIGGSNFRATIHKALTDAEKVLVLWSRHSTESAFVIDEASEAKKHGKLIPISLDDSSPPFGFGDLHIISWRGTEKDIEPVIAALQNQPQRRVPTQPPSSVSRRSILTAVGLILALGLIGSAYWFNSKRVVPVPPELGGGPRIAVVMGNNKYQHLPLLAYAVEDAEQIATELEKRGFKVIKLINSDRNATIRAITDFENTLAITGGVGLFYYAGQAAFVDGQDVMLPVDARVDTLGKTIVGGVNFTKLTAEVRAKITEPIAYYGSATIYSASKGQVSLDGLDGPHSPFTTAVLEALGYEDDELGEFFRKITVSTKRQLSNITHKQTPFMEDTRQIDFYFNKPQHDPKSGALKILFFDSCRDNPFKLNVSTR